MKQQQLTSWSVRITGGLLVGLVSAGCGQENPSEPTDTTEQPYYPLVVGATWEYQHSDWVEQVTTETAEYDGGSAFLMTDSPNPSDDLRSDSFIVSKDGRVVRVAKDEYLVGAGDAAVLTSHVTYGVGFTRFNEDWGNQQVGFKETPEYERIETPPGMTAKPAEARRHTFEVISLSEEVATPAGRFDCIVIKRTKDWEAEEEGVDASDADTKTYWFARGVGKVQERNEETGSTEVLQSYSIPGASR